jgi:hypothetical protein
MSPQLDSSGLAESWMPATWLTAQQRSSGKADAGERSERKHWAVSRDPASRAARFSLGSLVSAYSFVQITCAADDA